MRLCYKIPPYYSISESPFQRWSPGACSLSPPSHPNLHLSGPLSCLPTPSNSPVLVAVKSREKLGRTFSFGGI